MTKRKIKTMKVSFAIATFSLISAFAASAATEASAAGPEVKGVVDVVLQHGVVGAMLLIVLYGYWQERKRGNDESAARTADAKAYGEAMRSLVVTTTTQMERFNDTAEALVQELRNERHASPQRPVTGPGIRVPR